MAEVHTFDLATISLLRINDAGLAKRIPIDVGVDGDGVEDTVYGTPEQIVHMGVDIGVTTNALIRSKPSGSKKLAFSTVTLDDYGHIASLGSLTFSASPTSAPTGAGSASWDNTSGTLSLTMKGGNYSHSLGQGEIQLCYNPSGSVSLTKGQVVRISGTQEHRLSVAKAIASSSAGVIDTVGFVAENISTLSEGIIVVDGLIKNLDTTVDSHGNALSAGDILYVSPSISGGYTKTKPNIAVQIGFVAKVHATTGSIHVRQSLSNLNAANLFGIVPDASFPATLPAVNGSLLTSLNASNLASGTVGTARLGTGTANASSVLLGNQSWGAFSTLAQSLLETISSDEGTILYRGTSGWQALPTGDDGQILTTHVDAAPTWEDPPSGTVDPLVDIGNDGSGNGRIGLWDNADGEFKYLQYLDGHGFLFSGALKTTSSLTVDGSAALNGPVSLTGSLTQPGLKLASINGDPTSGLLDGQIWHNSSAGSFQIRLSGVTRSLVHSGTIHSSLEIGSTDATITRLGAGIIAVEGVAVPTISSTHTLTNKTLTSPVLVTPALGTPTSGNFSTGTFTWPTFNQNTTGSAATLTTPRTINGVSFDGSANITIPTGSLATWTILTANATLVAGQRYQADTSSISLTLTLPASASVGDEIIIEDAKFSWGTRSVTLARNGLLIGGGTSNYNANVTGGKLTCVYISAGYGWSIK
jgi:hypothetical protein